MPKLRDTASWPSHFPPSPSRSATSLAALPDPAGFGPTTSIIAHVSRSRSIMRRSNRCANTSLRQLDDASTGKSALSPRGRATSDQMCWSLRSGEALRCKAAQHLHIRAIDKPQHQFLYACFFIGRCPLANRLRAANQGGLHLFSHTGLALVRHKC